MSDVLTNDNGEVAVLYSPGFGAGWYTWASNEHPSMVLDRELAQAVLDGDHARALQIAEVKWPDEYHGGVADLKIEWMRPGTCFRIEEYDGSESITYSYEDWISVPVPASCDGSGEAGETHSGSTVGDSAVGLQAETTIHPSGKDHAPLRQEGRGL